VKVKNEHKKLLIFSNRIHRGMDILLILSSMLNTNIY